MKKFLILAVAVIAMAGCQIKDIPSVTFNEESYTVSSEGGELIIPVSSTGVDDVIITYRHSDDAWEYDQSTGDMTPTGGWIKVVKVINNYEQTRELAKWTSGIYLQIEPNNSDCERVGYVTVRSFMAEDKVAIKQGF